MKLPRGVSGEELAKALGKLGYGTASFPLARGGNEKAMGQG